MAYKTGFQEYLQSLPWDAQQKLILAAQDGKISGINSNMDLDEATSTKWLKANGYSDAQLSPAIDAYKTAYKGYTGQNYVNTTEPDYQFDDLLRQLTENKNIQTGQINDDYNRFLNFQEQDASYFKEGLAKAYAKALSSNFDSSISRGGERSSLRTNADYNTETNKIDKQQSFNREQARQKNIAEYNKNTRLSSLQRNYASSLSQMGSAYSQTI